MTGDSNSAAYKQTNETKTRNKQYRGYLNNRNHGLNQRILGKNNIWTYSTRNRTQKRRINKFKAKHTNSNALKTSSK